MRPAIILSKMQPPLCRQKQRRCDQQLAGRRVVP